MRKDVDGIVVGQGVAKSLGLKIGDRVNLVISLAQGAVNTLGLRADRRLPEFLKGVRRTGSPHSTAGRAGTDGYARRPCAGRSCSSRPRTPTRVATELEAAYGPKGFEVARWNKLSDFYEKTVDLYDRQFGVLQLIILLMVLLSVANSVNMSIFERTREFGTVIALGTRAQQRFSAPC